MSVMSWIKRFALIAESCLKRINLVLTVVSMLVIATLAVIVAYQVLMRYVFERPTSWVFEIAKYALVFIIFLPLGYAQQLGQHVRVDAITTRLPKKMQTRVEIVALGLSMFFIVLLLWSALDYALLALERGWSSDTWGLGIPTFPILIMIPIGLFFLLLNQFVTLIRHVADLFPEQQDDS